MIQMAGVRKDYDGVQALRDFSLTVGRGEVVGFLGPNGAGKTTTIKLLMGMLFPSSGAILVDGIDPVQDPVEVRRRVGYLPDVPFLYEYLSPRETLALVGSLYPLSADEICRRTDELFQEFDLTDRADELINSLSKGMRKKVSVSLALLHRPPVLLLDEPTSGLDPHSVKVLKDRIRRERDGGTTILLSTHVLEVAQEVATSLAVIHEGCLVYAASMQDAATRAAGKGQSLESLFLELTRSL